MKNERQDALLSFLGLGEAGPDDLAIAEGYDENSFTVDGGEYLVLTDDEADEKTAEYIKDSLWAFNPSFLSQVTDFDASIFEAIQSNDKCESNNDAIAQLIGDDMEYFIEQAISADGRGHFLSSYDGDEGEAGKYFVYRIN